MKNHLIGLLLGTEEDWSTAFEELMRRSNPRIDFKGETHSFSTERITIEPFDLRAVPRHALVIDRLAHWYYVPREWLKKAALMNDVYLLNNPFTFQSMEKHSAYCAMIRLGLKIPETWMVPHKKPPLNPRFPYTASRYNLPFDLEDVADNVGYPLYMKPFDGGAWVGVTRVRDARELHLQYDESGERLMHLQASIEDFDVFARSLSIGAETMVMRFDPDRPMHDRYRVEHGFLSPPVGREVVRIGRLVNAFFRWEFNSCETLIKGEEVHPIDFANACPDMSLISLHYYFPWAIKTLAKWAIYCTVTERRMPIDLDTRSYFDIADRADMTYGERIEEYGRLADEYFEIDAYHEFCDEHLGEIDEVMVDFVDGAEFDRLLIATVRATFPRSEQDHFIAHYRGLLNGWAHDQRSLSSPDSPA
ncbi:MAG: ATP-grasp domain-containing protein [Actinomycetota bacterium]